MQSTVRWQVHYLNLDDVKHWNILIVDNYSQYTTLEDYKKLGSQSSPEWKV